MPTFKPADRVELIHCADPHTTLVPGMLGTVTFIDDAGTVHVHWDCGSQLGMLLTEGDAIRRVATDDRH
ncbi:DUF4314 domain-containing protein [Lentzea sp. NPDC059081]|uniref:DUF4314 domain-containing protein n=1 Tax=Lentzea sp. NPDC059081 TaxID=3346719 RepID=UPI0036CC4B16